MTAESKQQKQSTAAKPRQVKTRIIRLSINPFILIISLLLVFFLFAGWMNGGVQYRQITLSEFIQNFQDNKYSRVEIRDNGEVVAQDKYILATTAEGFEPPQLTNPGTQVQASPIKAVDAAQLIEQLKPQDPLSQLRNVLTGSSSSRIGELIIGEDFVLGINAVSGQDHFLIQNTTQQQFELELANSGLSIQQIPVSITLLNSASEEISAESFSSRFSNGLFSSVYQIGDKVYGRVANDNVGKYMLRWDGGFSSFVSTLQSEGISLSGQSSVLVTFPVTTIPWGDIISLLTLVGFVFLGFILFRSIQGSGSGLMRFGQSKARMFWGVKPDITFDDVAGVDEAKEELSEIVQFLKQPNKFRRLGARIPKGVLMIGLPGSGKTLLARAIAGEAGVPFFHTSGSEFEEMLVGAGASRVRDLFDKAKKASPSLIFIDEIDAVARKRGTTIQSSTTEQTLNQILVEMDGFEQNVNVIVIAATNRPDVLDPAILRPGRFDRRISLDLPDSEGRKKILEIHAKNKPLAADVSLDKVAKRTIGFSGAELENTLNEAAIIAAKRNATEISYLDIEEAASKVMMGPAKTSRKRDDYTLKLVAYHEAGHAVVSKFMPKANPVHRVSIIARGGAGGVTEFIPLDENQITSRTKLLSNIAVALGGRAAEQIFMDDVSTGASGDISSATNLVRNMVQKFGMSDKLGLVKYGDSLDLEHLGYGYGENKDYSEETAKIIDQEVRAIMSEAYNQAVEILNKNKEVVNKLKDMLLEKEVVEAEEFDMLFEGVEGAIKRPESHKFKD